MRLGFNFTPLASCFALTLSVSAVLAQDADAVLGSPGGWQRYDWLSPADATAGKSEAAGKITASSTQEIGDPFSVANSGALWQQKFGATYVYSLPGDLTLFYESSEITMNESSDASAGTPDDLSHVQKAGLKFHPAEPIIISGNLHDSADDAASPANAVETRGGGVTAEGHLPFGSVLTVGADSDTTTAGTLVSSNTTDTSYDAQFKQPLGKLPLTAVVKGHYEETTNNGAPATSLPSMEQSLVWKPADATTVQMGLRQQHYQAFPGVSNELNETVFADWSQTLLPEITWHSYAEVLDSRSLDLAPAAPTATGANGTAQSADPTSSMALPNSLSTEAVTFSTGPSFRLDRDVSASVEYSNRLDRMAAPGDAGQEQRVSVSLKGSF